MLMVFLFSFVSKGDWFELFTSVHDCVEMFYLNIELHASTEDCFKLFASKGNCVTLFADDFMTSMGNYISQHA